MEPAMPKLTLVSHDLCPYVQRAVIALAEKGVRFERVYIDLAAKPDWFRAISPLGKVPLLRVGADVIFQSAASRHAARPCPPSRHDRARLGDSVRYLGPRDRAGARGRRRQDRSTSAE